MKKKNTVWFVMMLMIAALFLFTGCGKSKEAEQLNAYLEENYSAPEEKGYPAPDDLADALEAAEFSVERYEETEELGITADRVKAIKGEEYLDICYGVTDEQDVQDIMEYYIEQYDKCNIMTAKDAVVCYSSQAVAEQAGLLAE